MKVRVTVSNTIPTTHNHRLIQPKIEVEDSVLPGETPQQAFRRISLLANSFFAREVLDQLRFTDRMVSESNEAWCDEYLSTVAEDHPANKPNITPETLPDELRQLIRAMAQEFTARVEEGGE